MLCTWLHVFLGFWLCKNHGPCYMGLAQTAGGCCILRLSSYSETDTDEPQPFPVVWTKQHCMWYSAFGYNQRVWNSSCYASEPMQTSKLHHGTHLALEQGSWHEPHATDVHALKLAICNCWILSSHCIFVGPLPCCVLIPLFVCFIAANHIAKLRPASRAEASLELYICTADCLTCVLFQAQGDRPG